MDESSYLGSMAWVVAVSVAVLVIVPVMVILVVVLKPLMYIHLTPKGRRAKRLIDSIPGPPHKPFLGNAHDVWVSRERILDFRNENCRKYYPFYKVWYLGQFSVDPVGPEYVEAILRSSKHTEKGWLYDLLRPWLGNGLLTSKGEKWFSHRKFLTPAFHFKILEEFVPMFVERSMELADKLSEYALSGEAFDIVPVISHCTLEVICESAMGIKLDPERKDQRDYIAAIYRFGELAHHRGIRPWCMIDWVFALTKVGKEQKQVLRTLHSFSENVIKSKKMEYIKSKTARVEESNGHQQKPTKRKLRAFLELLIEMAVEERLLTDEEIREEVDTFMFEGHDTTSMAICYTIFMLANHPEIQEQVRQEVESCFDSGRASNVDALGELHLMERVIKETLRIYPSVPYIARVLTEDFQMGEYMVPAGATINLAISGIHMNPSVFPDPKTFDPDRFLPEAVKTRHPYAYIPFSAGPRNCIGQRFAMLEMKTVLSTLVKNYNIHAVDKPEDVELMHDIVLRPTKGLRIRLEARRKSYP
ncbi:cytochrome P450 4C1-like [Ischnura elegans]|uniref:cytochrome P450 4C1-like n=1 Tax=Ischnura elegans TaxID=197161 RepID=UPI001ED871A2|nr:cytochrome P450 4C1-like [Ischnura elegans]